MFIETTTKPKLFEARCPQLHRAILGKRYLLPQYRIADYENQDALNQPMIDWFRAALSGRIDFTNDLMRMMLVNYAMSLCYNRPTLYLERELGEALVRTDLPPDLSTKDIRFKWPQLRIILPSGTISREEYSVSYLDLCLVEARQTVHWPEPIRSELQSFPLVENQLTGTGFNLLGAIGPTFYSYRSAWNDQTLQQSGRVCDHTCDQTDRNLTDRMFRLSLNLLLFLSAAPLEYDPAHCERPARLEGNHLKPALARAHFVGQEAYRPKPKPSPKKPTRQLPGDRRHFGAHWAAGHWRRTACGKGRSERRLQWISVYFAGGKGEHATDESANETPR
jgi:hypothetical protein